MRRFEESMSTRDLQPVLLGTDLGIYGLARSFHEAYGVRSVVVSEQPRGPINDSAIIDNVFMGADADDATILATLAQVAAAHPDADRILMVNSDHQVAFVMRYREQLERDFLIPFAPAETLAKVADKRALNAALARLGIAFPATVELQVAGGDDRLWRASTAELTFPIVLKPAQGAEFEQLTFAGRHKIYALDDADALVREMRKIADAGFAGTMLAQELIPGDDTWNRVVNVYVDSRGELTMSASGHVLLGLHQPRFIGNSAIVLLDYNEALVQQVAAVLAEVDFRGFASVDFKIDPRDGVARLLDINARIGRNHYYLNVGGANSARALVEDLVHGRSGEPQRATTPGVYAYIPTWLLRRYVTDKALLARTRKVLRQRRAVHPLDYPADRNLKRWAYRQMAQLTQLRGLWTFYRAPSKTGF